MKRDEIISVVTAICDEFDARSDSWATSDLAEAIECSVYCATVSLPRAAWQRYMLCLATRDSNRLDYDAVERLP